MTELCKSIYETHDTHITTYGVGSDFNREWMTKIANSGKGSYFYIDTKNNDDELTSVMLRRGFREFSKTMIKDISIRFESVDSSLVSVRESTDLLKMLSPIKIASMTETDLVQFLFKIRPFSYSVTNQLNVILAKAIVNYTDYNENENKVVVECDLNYKSEISLNSNTACHIYNTIVNCGKLENEITELLKTGNKTKSIELKNEIIGKYENVLEQDKMGLVEKLLSQAKETLRVMESENDLGRVAHTHAYFGGYAGGCAGPMDGDSEEEELAVCFGAGDMDAAW
jgi:hypothetical protein